MCKLNRNPRDPAGQDPDPQSPPPRMRTCEERVLGARSPLDGSYNNPANTPVLGMPEEIMRNVRIFGKMLRLDGCLHKKCLK
jgi:hypothetical protein